MLKKMPAKFESHRMHTPIAAELRMTQKKLQWDL
jgi:hypothetical protein